jgi:nucleosome binding factor SPN SPT16 subunit
MNIIDEDPSFHCYHIGCKRIKTTSCQFLKANQIIKIQLQLDVVDLDIVYNVNTNNAPWKSLYRFVYPDPDLNTVTIPIISKVNMFLDPNTILFTICGITLQTAWTILDDEEIFYSDDCDDGDNCDDDDDGDDGGDDGGDGDDNGGNGDDGNNVDTGPDNVERKQEYEKEE